MTYDEIIQEAGKRVEKNVYYIVNNQRTDVNIDNIENVKISFNSPLIGTLMQGAELTLKEPISGEIYIEIEARYQSYTATKTYGPYFLKQEPTYQADSKNYLHILYDAIIKSMVQYEELQIQYPCTLYNFFIGIVNACGYTTNIASLPNGSIQITGDKYIGLNYTYRDVLEDIAIANGVLLYVDGNEIKIAQPSNQNEIVIDDDILKNQNIEFGQHFGPINTIVLSRAVSDNIEINDPTGVAQNGVKEFKISDNQMMNDNDRSDYLQALLSQLNGLEYDIYDTELTGYGNITPLQRVHFTTDENNYYSYVFNNEIVITDGYKQSIFTELPEETNTDYTMTDKTDKRINQTTLIVDKQNQIIQSMITNYLDFLQSDSRYGFIELEDVFTNGMTRLEISGIMSLLYPSDTLYPSNTLYPLDSYLIIEDENEEIKKYQLGINYLNQGDKYIYTYEFDEETNGYIAKAIIKRSNDTIEELEAPIFEMPRGNYKIYMESFDSLNYNVEYVIHNDLTNTLATNTQLATSITQTRNEIDIKAQQMVNKDNIIADLNVGIKNGQGVIEMVGNVVKINSDNFELSADGSIIANNGKFRGEINGSSIKGGTIDLFDTSTSEGSSLSLWENEGEIGTPMGHYMTLYSGGLYCGDDSLGTAVRLDSGGYIGCDSLGVADSVEVFGNLRVYGSKNRIVEIENNKKVLLNAYETATPYFGDIGSDKTNKNGYCKIYIEDIFSQTIENDDYKVFIQECGDGHLYVKKYNNYFEVIGTPNLDFDYEIKAIQKGYKNIRLKEFDKGGK